MKPVQTQCMRRATAIASMLAAVCALTTHTASAQQATTQPLSQPLSQPVEIGDSTHAWLALQRDNTGAAPPQPMLGAEAGLAYQRYLDSFKTKIPASFTSTTEMGGANNLHVDYSNSPGAQN